MALAYITLGTVAVRTVFAFEQRTSRYDHPDYCKNLYVWEMSVLWFQSSAFANVVPNVSVLVHVQYDHT